MDGTLIDSAKDVALAANIILEKYKKASIDFEQIKAHMGTGPGKLVLDLFPDLNDPNSPNKQQIFQEYLDCYQDNMTQNTVAYPGVFEFLKQWKGQLALVTNKPQELALPLMEKLGFNQYLWVTQIGGNTFPVKKPNPLPLEKAMEIAKVDKQHTVMIGDGLPDIGAANNAGIPSIAVSYGYTPIEKLMTAGATASIDSITQLTTNFLDNIQV